MTKEENAAAVVLEAAKALSINDYLTVARMIARVSRPERSMDFIIMEYLLDCLQNADEVSVELAARFAIEAAAHHAKRPGIGVDVGKVKVRHHAEADEGRGAGLGLSPEMPTEKQAGGSTKQKFLACRFHDFTIS